MQRIVLTLSLLLPLALTALPPAASAAPMRWTPTIGSPFGINTHSLLWDGNPKAVAALKDAGIMWVRADWNWRDLEPAKGQFNWKIADGMVNTAIKHGFNLFPTLGYCPKWAAASTSSGGNEPMPRSSAEWANFVSKVVQRYKGKVSHWGMWNEPNLEHFLSYPSTMSLNQRIDHYTTQILIAGAKAVKAADPDAFVLGPELAHMKESIKDCGLLGNFHKACWQPWLEGVLKKGGSHIDVITHHIYKDDFVRYLDGSKQLWECPKTVVKAIADGGGTGKPVWITEIGWHTDTISEAAQATHYRNMLESMLKRSWWTKIFPYELKDDPNIKDKWGILRADWSRKPAWTAYRDFVKANTPVPNAGGDRTASTGVPVQFDASGSTDPHGKIVNYSWDFDHSNGVGQDATGVKASRIYAKSGTFLVTLTVTDDTGIAIGTRVKVTVSGSTQPKTYAITATPKGGVRLDGKLTEWAGAKVVNLSCTDFVRVSGSCGGDGDLYARARLMWNTGGIYLGIAVTDNVQRNTGSPGTLWSGDSIQIAFDADGGRQGPGYGAGDYEFGLALLGAQPST